jgi:hypothetical protein
MICSNFKGKTAVSLDFMSSEEDSSRTPTLANDWASTLTSFVSIFEFLFFSILFGLSVAVVAEAGVSSFDSDFMKKNKWLALLVFLSIAIFSMASFMFAKTVNKTNALIYYGCALLIALSLIGIDIFYQSYGGLSSAILVLGSLWGCKLSNIL